jgi:hypothetical protein
MQKMWGLLLLQAASIAEIKHFSRTHCMYDSSGGGGGGSHHAKLCTHKLQTCSLQ